jgi:hypothetical protein
MTIHPRLLEAEQEVITAKDVVRTLQGRRDALAHDLLNEALGTNHKPYEVEHGTWKCPEDMLEGGTEPDPGPVSPTGRCVYVPKDDPMRDDCLFCHGPDERK